MARLSQLLAGRRAYAAGLAVLVVLLGVMMLGPLESLSAASDRVAVLQAERDRRAAEVEDLQARADALQQPEQVELRARRELGMVEPGEIPFVVVTPEPEPSPSAPAPVPADDAWYDRLLQAASGLFD